MNIIHQSRDNSLKKVQTKVIALDEPGSLRERLDCTEWTATESITVMSHISSKDIALLNGLAHNTLTNINLEDARINTIPNNAFENCISLESINLPSCDTIPNSIFKGCTSLTNIIIHEDTTAIEDDAFSNCISLQSIKLPSNISLIGKNVFSNCTNLKHIYLNCSYPPICSDDSFNNIPKTCKIIIPQELVNEYTEYDYWKKIVSTEANKKE